MSKERDRLEFIHFCMKYLPVNHAQGETEGDLRRKALLLMRYAATHRRIETNLTNAFYRKHTNSCATQRGQLCDCPMVEDGEATRKAIAQRDRIDAKMEAIAPIVYGALTVSVRMGNREVYIP